MKKTTLIATGFLIIFIWLLALTNQVAYLKGLVLMVGEARLQYNDCFDGDTHYINLSFKTEEEAMLYRCTTKTEQLKIYWHTKE